jgi:O-antigen ligase
VFDHKNSMGRIMLLGALLYWILSQRHLAARSWYLTGLALCLVMVVLSQSRTAWVVLGLFLVCIPLLRFLRRPEFPLMVRLSLVFFGVAGAAVLLTVSLELIFTLLQRDETLTDRTTIWATGFEAGKERLWLGYGYRSFWLGVGGLTRFFHGHGHNSFLDIWLETGLIGLGLFLFTLAVFAHRAFVCLISSDSPLGLWYCMFIVYILLFSMTSQVIPHHGTITWVLYVAGLLYLSPLPAEAPATAPPRAMAASRPHV